MVKAMLTLLLVCGICFVQQLHAQRGRGTNCAIGSACDNCPEGEYDVLNVGTRRVRVCCSGCGPKFTSGYRTSDGRPFCSCKNDIGGDCWVGNQCNQCLNGTNAGYVGYINSVPVCCENCERSGLAMSPSVCNCRHNGP